MKKLLKTIACVSLVTGSLGALGVARAGDLTVSLGIGGQVAPGVYGTVNVTNARPSLVIADPVMVHRPVRYVEPIYLSVPPGHAKHWGKFCGRYNACSRPVYFVRSPEYRGFRPSYIQNTYVVKNYHREDRRDGPREWEGRGDQGGDFDRDDRGPGHGHGRGHGHGHGRD